MNEREDSKVGADGRTDTDVERRLMIPRQILGVSSALTTALLSVTVGLYSLAASQDGCASLVSEPQSALIQGLLVVSAIFFFSTLFSLHWCLFESIPKNSCLKLLGFSWRTSIPGSNTFLIFFAGLASLILMPVILILPRIRQMSWAWGPLSFYQANLVRVGVSAFFVLFFWLSVQEVVAPFLSRPPSIPGILYVLLFPVLFLLALLPSFLPWAVLLSAQALFLAIPVLIGWGRIAKSKQL